MKIFYKDPDDTLDYYVDSTKFLEGDTILTSVWIVPTGITQGTTSNTTTRATVWLSGGMIGETFQLTNRITTAGGRIKDESFLLKIVEN